MLGQEARDRHRVLAVPLHPQRQRFDPCRKRKELNGLIAGPMSRRPWTRSLMMKAMLAPKFSTLKTSVKTSPW